MNKAIGGSQFITIEYIIFIHNFIGDLVIYHSYYEREEKKHIISRVFVDRGISIYLIYLYHI
ncbi:MAG: hypothetical protein RBG13Loki_0417 [Promethearchaeota archaeon CR_4]|nr:MAG: hypothetical protein RBG13Loki_0417 [Candidatus Lokiarchaeota archaeon CR_4]